MAKYSNTSASPIVLPGGQTIPARGSIEIAAKDAQKDHPVVKGLFDAGTLVSGDLPDVPTGRVERVADLTDPVVIEALREQEGKLRDGIEERLTAARAEGASTALERARETWNAFATLPEDAKPDAASAAMAAHAEALGLGGEGAEASS